MIKEPLLDFVYDKYSGQSTTDAKVICELVKEYRHLKTHIQMMESLMALVHKNAEAIKDLTWSYAQANEEAVNS